MRDIIRSKFLLACSAFILIGWLWGNHNPINALADPTLPQKAEAPVFPMSARLGGNIYLQTSAEYRACCYMIYKCAELRLETVIENARPKFTKPAVVMDLDETVFDNSAFQTFLYANNLEYTEDLWADYEENYSQDVTLIPGAKQFIEKAKLLGVTVVFISNRSKLYKKSTEDALERLGIGAAGLVDCLYLKPKGGSSDKSPRREAVAAKYNVLMYFGDNLRDFSESFAAKKLSNDAMQEDYLKAIERRESLADDAVCHWGVDWFVLPNPVYGEWEKLIGPNSTAILHPTSMKLKVPVP
jgi:5'-nucleotidase (lipoprotein e(P4) family)